jgi:polyisoprenoid-binding protein YceI
MRESAQCSRYVVVTSESLVKIEARSSLHPIKGRGVGLQGYVDAAFWGDGLRRDAPVRLHLEIPVAKLNSGNPAQDREMHRLMSSRSFPNIVADLVDATPTDQPNRYAVTGSIGVRGTTRVIAGEITVRQRDGRVEIDGEQTVDIRTFGIQPPRILMFSVFPEVTINLHVVAMLAA